MPIRFDRPVPSGPLIRDLAVVEARPLRFGRLRPARRRRAGRAFYGVALAAWTVALAAATAGWMAGIDPRAAPAPDRVPAAAEPFLPVPPSALPSLTGPGRP